MSLGLAVIDLLTSFNKVGIYLMWWPGDRFSKLPVITGPVKLFCFPFQMGVSKGLNITQQSY